MSCEKKGYFPYSICPEKGGGCRRESNFQGKREQNIMRSRRGTCQLFVRWRGGNVGGSPFGKIRLYDQASARYGDFIDFTHCRGVCDFVYSSWLVRRFRLYTRCSWRDFRGIVGRETFGKTAHAFGSMDFYPVTGGGRGVFGGELRGKYAILSLFVFRLFGRNSCGDGHGRRNGHHSLTHFVWRGGTTARAVRKSHCFFTYERLCSENT